MPKIPNWSSLFVRALDEDPVQDRIEKYGHGVIAKIEHDPTGCEVEYIYQPEADKPYLLKCVTEGVVFEQEGRYETRDEGYENGSRPLRHQNPEIPELQRKTQS